MDITDGAFNSDRLIEFLDTLINNAGKKFVSCSTTCGLPTERKKIELDYLPSDSPEPNPKERLNADIKHTLSTNAQPKATTTEHMRILEKSPRRVKRFFQDTKVNAV